jgi:tRNA(Leu) C34 or U34 (ribose-2'-O)-methylase TrmL
MVALYQPDIAQNTGTILRMCACLGLTAAIIEPAGFPTSDRHFWRAGMDYLAHVAIARYPHWEAFEDWRRANGRRQMAAYSLIPGRHLILPIKRTRLPPATGRLPGMPPCL